MVDALVHFFGLEGFIDPLWIRYGWVILGMINISLAWMTGILYRRQKLGRRWSSGLESACLYGLLAVVIFTNFLTLFDAFAHPNWDAALVWIFMTRVTIFIGTKGMLASGFRYGPRPVHPPKPH